MSFNLRILNAGPSRALLPDAMRLGPVRLVVTNLERAVAFYATVLGLKVARRGQEGGRAVAHLATDQEEIVVLEENSQARKAGRHAGLYHVAYNFPTRLELARSLRRIVESRTPIEGASDHRTHEAIYLRDPDGNGLELAWDFSEDRWPRTAAEFPTGPEPLDLEGLLALTSGEPAVPTADAGLRVGHLHLHVGNIQRAVDFYVGLLGLEHRADLGSGAFMSAGGYHHHLGVNVWRGQDAPPVPADVVGLREWRVYLPTTADVDAARERMIAGGVAVAPAGGDAFTVSDPWGIPLHVGRDPRLS